MAGVLPRILWVALLAFAVASVGLAVLACLPDDALASATTSIPASSPTPVPIPTFIPTSVPIPTLIPTSVPTPSPAQVSILTPVPTSALDIPESPALTAAEIFQLSVEAMKFSDSFSYVLETVVPVDDSGLSVVSFLISGAFLAPDRGRTGGGPG